MENRLPRLFWILNLSSSCSLLPLSSPARNRSTLKLLPRSNSLLDSSVEKKTFPAKTREGIICFLLLLSSSQRLSFFSLSLSVFSQIRVPSIVLHRYFRPSSPSTHLDATGGVGGAFPAGSGGDLRSLSTAPQHPHLQPSQDSRLSRLSTTFPTPTTSSPASTVFSSSSFSPSLSSVAKTFFLPGAVCSFRPSLPPQATAAFLDVLNLSPTSLLSICPNVNELSSSDLRTEEKEEKEGGSSGGREGFRRRSSVSSGRSRWPGEREKESVEEKKARGVRGQKGKVAELGKENKDDEEFLRRAMEESGDMLSETRASSSSPSSSSPSRGSSSAGTSVSGRGAGQRVEEFSGPQEVDCWTLFNRVCDIMGKPSRFLLRILSEEIQSPKLLKDKLLFLSSRSLVSPRLPCPAPTDWSPPMAYL